MEFQTNNPFLNFKARSIFLWFFLICFALGFITSFLNLKITEPILTYVFYCLIFGLLCIWIIRRCYKLQINPKYLIGNLPQGYKWLPIIGLVIAVLLFSLGAGLLSFHFLSLLAPSVLESLLKSIATDRAKNSSLPIFYLILNAFSLVVVAPIAEEFIFRGILLHRWAAKWGVSSAILVSSILFGLLHINPFGLSVFGIVMALLYLRSRTIIVPIIAHSLNNACVVAIQFLPKDSSMPAAYKASGYWQYGLIFMAISAPFLIHFIYKKWPNKQISLPYFANANQHNTQGL